MKRKIGGNLLDSLCVLFLLAGMMFAQSQPPSPAKPEKAQPEKKEISGAGRKTGGDKTATQSPTPPKIIGIDTPKIEDQTKNTPNVPTSDWRIIGLTAGLLIVAGVQAYIYFRQAQYMKRGLRLSMTQMRIANKSAIAARLSADAANLSAVAAMNSQRAWVVVDPAELAPQLIPTDYSAGGAVATHFFAYRVWNAGKSTATNVKAFARYATFGSLSEIPPEPRYGPLEALPGGALIPTDGPTSQRAMWSLKWLEPSTILSVDDVQNIQAQKRFLFAYGIVCYGNGAGKTCTTKWGFVYHFPVGGDWRPKGFQAGGPSGYNDYT